MNKKIVFTLLCFFVSLSFISCERYPITDLHSIPSPVDSWPYPWYIYDDEINTKGRLAPVMFDDDAHTGDISVSENNLNFDYEHGAYRGRACIKFDWYPKNGKTWCGFGLPSTQDPEKPSSSKNMETSGYTKLKFFIKGWVSSGAEVLIEIPRNDYNGNKIEPTDKVSITNLTDTWTEMSIPLNQTKNNWNTQKYYFAITIKGANGATVYLDDIRFVKD